MLICLKKGFNLHFGKLFDDTFIKGTGIKYALKR